MEGELLIIAHQWPDPSASAAGWRLLQLAEVLRNAFGRIRIACTVREGKEALALKEQGFEVSHILINDDSFDEQVRRWSPSVVIFDRFMTEEQFGWRVRAAAPNALRVLDTEDLHSLRWARGVALTSGASEEEAWRGSELLLREFAAILRSDLSLIISEHEMGLLQRELGLDERLLHYIPFLFDGNNVHRPGFDLRKDFMCIGNFLHAPNLDAVIHLKEVVWPKIRSAVPEARCYIYGSNYDPKKHPTTDAAHGFMVEGYVPETDEVFQKHRVMLAPLRFGAGLKGKVFEAMKFGLPVVTTSVGAEGYGDHSTFPGMVRDPLELLVKAAVELYEDKAGWMKSQEAAASILEQRFHIDLHAPLLLRRLEGLLDNLENHRNANILGRLLWREERRSAEFMSRWIEEKNKGSQSSN